jgi:hypothetical protein
LLGYFPGHSLTLARGLRDADPDAGFRRDVCRFVDDRVTPVERARFVHALLGRDMAEVRLFLDRLERYALAIEKNPEPSADLKQALDAIATDAPIRSRYLQFMRASDDASLRVRMIDLALHFGWLSPEERLAELGSVIAARYARPVLTAADVDFVCRLNRDHALDGSRILLHDANGDAGHAAVLACLGDTGQRRHLLQALTSGRDGDVEVAQDYLQYYPIADVGELRDVASGIAQMTDTGAQVRALDTLADHRVSDPQALSELAHLFPATKSIDVQRAIAGVLIRSDYPGIATSGLVRTLREYRLKSHQGRDLIDVLIGRLEDAAA